MLVLCFVFKYTSETQHVSTDHNAHSESLEILPLRPASIAESPIEMASESEDIVLAHGSNITEENPSLSPSDPSPANPGSSAMPAYSVKSHDMTETVSKVPSVSVPAQISPSPVISASPVYPELLDNGKQATPGPPKNSMTPYFRARDPIEAYLSPKMSLSANFHALQLDNSYDIEDGQWKTQVPMFAISIPRYSQRLTADGKSECTIFEVVSYVPERMLSSAHTEALGIQSRHFLQQKKVVQRRYTHFQYLHANLNALFPLLSLPDLPEKRLTGRFSNDFLEVRRRDLERFLRRLVRHDLVRGHRAFLAFLETEDEAVSIATS